MTEHTITFTPEKTLAKGFFLIGRGIVLIARSTASIVNRSVHAWPYVYISLVFIATAVVGITSVRKARAERDAALHQQYVLQQRNEQLQIAKDFKQ